MVLAGTLLLAQASLSFSAPAAPASRVIPALGKAAGISLTVAPALAREVLLIEAKGTTFKDLAARVALVTSGEWEASEGGYRLALPSRTDVRQRREQAAALADGLLGRFRTAANGAPTPPLAVILGRLPPETLVLHPKERIVLSTRPTAMQRLLPPEALQGVDLGAPRTGPIALVQLALLRADGSATLTVSLVAADAQDRTVARAQEYLYNNLKPVPPATLSKPDMVLRPTQEERDLATAIARLDPGTGASFGAEDQATVSPSYTEADLTTPPPGPKHPEFLTPEANEPLGLLAGPLVRRFAEAEGTSVVADIPDTAFSGAARFAARGETKAGDFAQALSLNLGMVLVFDGNGMVLRPRWPVMAREGRLDRAALGTAVRILARDRNLHLEDRAAYAAAQPLLEPLSTFEATYFAAFDPTVGRQIAASTLNGERQTMRLYHALGTQASKSALAFASLPPAAKDALTDLVFNSVANPVRVRRAPSPDGRVIMDYAFNTYGPPVSITEERTFYWGDGIPKEAVLTISGSATPSYFGLAPNGARVREGEGGTHTMTVVGDGSPVVSTSLPYVERYQKGLFRTVVFTLRMANDAEVTRRLTDASIPADAPVVAFDDLPEVLRSQILRDDETVRRMVDNYRRQRSQRTP